LNIGFHYLAPASVGRNIPDVGSRGTPDYRLEWQGAIRSESIDKLWIWKVFGSVILFGSGQIPNLHPSRAD